MDFNYSPKVEELRFRVNDFMDRYVLPANAEWHREEAAGRYPLQIVDERKALAKEEGLWNLFLPSLRDDEPGTRLTNLEYAPLAEIMGRLPWSSEIFNCNAPDTGNMELLHQMRKPAAFDTYVAAIYRAMWVDGLNLGDQAVLTEVLQRGGLDPNEFLAFIQDPAVKNKLRAETGAAVERGIFGEPTMFVGGEMYFGQDRLDFVREALQ